MVYRCAVRIGDMLIWGRLQVVGMVVGIVGCWRRWWDYPPTAHQYAHQQCSIELLSAYYQPTICLHSAKKAVVRYCGMSSYKRVFRTVDPKVEGSSPFGLVILNPYELKTYRDFFVPSNRGKMGCDLK